MSITYEDIERNVAGHEVSGKRVKVVWKCPVSDTIVGESTGQIMVVSGTGTQFKTDMTRTLFQSIIRSVSDALRPILGHHIASGLRQATSRTANTAAATAVHSDQDKRDAIVRAFDGIKNKFSYDEEAMLWVAKKEN